MRTLLIDNYDSYTYNLFQLLAIVNGVEPVVLTNDAVQAGDLDLDAFDNIVISPGPGTPVRERDFGVAAHIVATAEIPVLGVCLGHQGIAAGAGARVVPAPHARHGHLTRVSHDGRDLFQGIPQGFIAVRYHSLCVPEPLPEALQVTARAEDGVVMGLRHRNRPLWGVQFHPESVASQFGCELVANFARLTREHRDARSGAHAAHAIRGGFAPAPAATSAASRRRVRRSPEGGGFTHRLRVRTLDVAIDAEALFTQMFAGAPRAFWLDSAHLEPGISRFSFLGDGTGPLSEFVSYRVGSGVVKVMASDGATVRVRGDIAGYLKNQLHARHVNTPALPFDFPCGYVGYFGYEFKGDCGSPNKFRSVTPDSSWLFADRMVVIDHEERSTYLLALDDRTPGTMASADTWLTRTAQSLSTLPQWRPARQTAPTPLANATVEPWLARDRDRYLADIEACQRELLAGESYEICLTNSVRLPGVGDGYTLYRQLRHHNPAPYAAYLKLDGVEVACSSPERYLRIDRHGVVEAKPIKGTAPRGSAPEEDNALREELATSPKTRAENLMIVDLLRNDLARVCEVGSVHVSRLMATESYRTVHQLVSTIRGRLRVDVDAIDCVRACFPGGSMTGAPKLRTMEIIDRLECEARGVYSGAIGFLACNGTMDLNIAIRTAVLAEGEWHIGAGGAIVLDSDTVEEYEEMLLKGKAVLRALFADDTPKLAAPADPAPADSVRIGHDDRVGRQRAYVTGPAHLLSHARARGSRRGPFEF